MFFVPPVPLIRRLHILKCLRNHGAFSPQTAVTLSQAGVFNPNAFPGVTRLLVRRNALAVTPDGRYYLPPSETEPPREEVV